MQLTSAFIRFKVSSTIALVSCSLLLIHFASSSHTSSDLMEGPLSLCLCSSSSALYLQKSTNVIVLANNVVWHKMKIPLCLPRCFQCVLWDDSGGWISWSKSQAGLPSWWGHIIIWQKKPHFYQVLCVVYNTVFKLCIAQLCLVTLLRATTMFVPLSVTYNDFRKNSLVLGLGLVLGLVCYHIQKCKALVTSAPAGY